MGYIYIRILLNKYIYIYLRQGLLRRVRNTVPEIVGLGSSIGQNASHNASAYDLKTAWRHVDPRMILALPT